MEVLELDGDVIAPRTERERYRIYRLQRGGNLDLIATCETPAAVGTCICTLGEEGEFLDAYLGVLDAMDHRDEIGEWIGKWLVLPWFTKGDPIEVRAVW